MPSARHTLLSTALALAILAPAARAQQAVDSLLAADRFIAAMGLGEAIRRAGAPKLVLLYPGAPIIMGRTEAFELVDAQAALRTVDLRWVPLYGEVSRDGTFGVTYGVTGIIDAEATPAATLRFGKYLTAWQRGSDGWKMVAHAQIGLLPPSFFVAPPGFRVPGLPSIARSGPVAEMVRTDSAFSALAGTSGAPNAFATYAAADGVLFPSTGDLARGPDAIRRLMGSGPQANWSWRPVAAMAAPTGDLGFTVGEARIAQPGTPAVFTKYLSLWRRDADGRVRFIADGGNVRPGPVSQ